MAYLPRLMHASYEAGMNDLVSFKLFCLFLIICSRSHHII